MDIIEKAIRIAAVAHNGQYRKSSKIPYITHPFSVGMILMDAGCEKDVIAAGILHDVVEDTSLTLKDIEEQFGDRIATIVEGGSEPNKELSWEERKQHTIDFLKTAPVEVKLVAAADKLHNLNSTLDSIKEQEEKVWDRFKRGKQSQEWYYRHVYKSILHDLSEEDCQHVIFVKLHKMIESVFD